MIILAAIVQAMMGLGLALPIEHRSSAGSAPVITGPFLQADFSNQANFEGWGFW